MAILDYASSVCGDDSHCHLVANHGCQSGHIDSLRRTSELKAAVSELFAGHVVACSCCNRRQRELCDGDKDVELTRCLPLPSSTLHSVIHHDGSSAAQGTRHDTTRPSNGSGRTAAQQGWQRLVWHVWDALPASKGQQGTATAPAVPIAVPDRPPTPSRAVQQHVSA